MLEVLSEVREPGPYGLNSGAYERTLEKSFEGDMIKLSAEFDHDMRCCIL